MTDAYRLYRDHKATLYTIISNHLPQEIGVTDELFEDIMSDVDDEITNFYSSLLSLTDTTKRPSAEPVQNLQQLEVKSSRFGGV